MKRQYLFICALSTLILCGASLIFTGEPVQADNVLRYSCSPQIYEAFGNERLEAFTNKTGVKVDLGLYASAVTIERLMSGLSDLAATVQRVTRTQKDSGLVETIFCKDPMAIIVNAECPVTNITDQQLQDVFGGKITSWKELGGPDKPIVVIVPSEQTAAYKNFHLDAMGGKEIVFDIMTTKSTMVIDTTRRIPGSISFTSQGAARLVTRGLSKLKINGLSVDDKDYPYSQIFSFVTRGLPTGAAKQYIEFSLSQEGKDIMKKKGMVPYTEVGE
jgi:phosphate transport system substrate-binding protein